MAVHGLNIKVNRDGTEVKVIKGFWAEMKKKYNINALVGLVHNVTDSSFEYLICLADDSMKPSEKVEYNDAKYKVVCKPFKGWVQYNGKIKDLDATLEELLKEKDFTYHLHKFTYGRRGKKFVILVNKDIML